MNREPLIGNDSPDRADAPEHPPHRTDRGHLRRVLVVEDNRDCRETLCWLLRLSGFQVERARDGDEGVRKALAWRPEAAVVDIGLPLLDGYEVARRLRAGLDGLIVLIALTGYGQPEDRSRALAAGFDHHLTKPAKPGDLLRLLQTPTR
jgi:CheY-like chemotaxis protein